MKCGHGGFPKNRILCGRHIKRFCFALLLADAHDGGPRVPVPAVREGVQGVADAAAAPEDPQRGVPRAVLGVRQGVPDQVAAQAAPDGPRRRAALPLPRVQLHLQDQAAAQRAPEEALGESVGRFKAEYQILFSEGGLGLFRLPSLPVAEQRPLT